MNADPRFGIGGNSPPPSEVIAAVIGPVNEWMTANPVIQNQEQHNAAAQMAQRANNCIKDLDEERKRKGEPLRVKLSGINDEYKAAIAPLDALLKDIHKRMTDFAIAAEDRRRAEAAEKARIAAETAAAAEAARRAALEARENAAVGEMVDLAAVDAAALATAREAQVAGRDAQRAERDIPVKAMPGLGGRAKTLRTAETLVVVDAVAALTEIATIAVPASLLDELLVGARAFRKLTGRLPSGVEAMTERRVG